MTMTTYLSEQTIKFDTCEEDEYLENGLPYCKNCHTPRFTVRTDENGIIVGYYKCICKCQSDKRKQDEEELAKKKRLEEFQKRQKATEMGARYFDVRFDNSVRTEKNGKMLDFCKRYCDRADEMLKDGSGLYIHGDNSTGKTHLTACICNELVERGYTCSFTSLPQILLNIKSKFNSDNTALSEAQIVHDLEIKQFVFIDDLGKEFMGGKSKFSEQVLLDVINARYKNNRPTIFTSNYTIDGLVNEFNIDKAIAERIKEMVIVSVELKCENFRELNKQEKLKRLKGEIE